MDFVRRTFRRRPEKPERLRIAGVSGCAECAPPPGSRGRSAAGREKARSARRRGCSRRTGCSRMPLRFTPPSAEMSRGGRWHRLRRMLRGVPGWERAVFLCVVAVRGAENPSPTDLWPEAGSFGRGFRTGHTDTARKRPLRCPRSIVRAFPDRLRPSFSPAGRGSPPHRGR